MTRRRNRQGVHPPRFWPVPGRRSILENRLRLRSADRNQAFKWPAVAYPVALTRGRIQRPLRPFPWRPPTVRPAPGQACNGRSLVPYYWPMCHESVPKRPWELVAKERRGHVEARGGHSSRHALDACNTPARHQANKHGRGGSRVAKLAWWTDVVGLESGTGNRREHTRLSADTCIMQDRQASRTA